MKLLTKVLTVFLLLFMAAGMRTLPAAGMKTRVIPELLNPDSIHLDDTQIYITEGPRVRIFNRESLEQTAVFGKAGEGPQEFRILPGLPLILNVEGDELMVNSFGKVTFFSKSGQFLREKRTQAGFIIMAEPFGENLACWGLAFEAQTRFRTIDLYDHDLNKIRNVVKQKDEFQAPGQGMDILSAAFTFSVMADRLWVACTPEAVIHTFDLKGDPVKTVTLDIPRREMTQADRETILDFLKTDKSTREQFDLIKPIRFRDQFPAIMAIFSAQNRLYVMTWQRREGRNEVLVLDKDGRTERKLWLPMAYRNALAPAPFAIRDSNLYQLTENDDEEWELCITPIQ
ncbi:MAG: hypothetical protein RB296_11210 [Acidobacteriota bacterium]|jgi:hypothetical protein|nr:hypothetical protein [Acidobacteriota bacterium]